MITNWIMTIILGVIALGIFVSILLLLRRAWKREVEKPRTKVRGNISRIKSRLLAPGHHPVAGLIVSNLLNRSMTHILEVGEWISLAQYITLLEESLGTCTRQFFATSLIPPDIWVNGKFKTDYRRYLDLQKKRFNMCREHGMKIQRVFIINKDQIPEDPLKHDIIKEQMYAGFGVGFSVKEDLAKRNPEFVRDFALFEDDSGKWVIDAGSILEPREEKWTYVRVVDDRRLIDTFYTSLVTRLESDIIAFGKQE